MMDRQADNTEIKFFYNDKIWTHQSLFLWNLRVFIIYKVVIIQLVINIRLIRQLMILKYSKEKINK